MMTDKNGLINNSAVEECPPVICLNIAESNGRKKK